METFYIVVLSVAIVFLILILTFFGIMMTGSNSVAYPPVATACPDNWVATDGSSCTIPSGPGSKNVGNIYTDANMTTFNNTFSAGTPGKTGQIINFSDVGWTSGNYAGLTPVCAQNKWATQFGVSWDGVSNFNGC